MFFTTKFKILVILLSIFIGALRSDLTAQDVIYKSDRLDSLVWEKINERLVSLGNKPIPVFDNGKVRDFSKRVCERMLPKDAPQIHSFQESI